MELSSTSELTQTPALFDALLQETKTGFNAIVKLVSAQDARVRQAQERISQLEHEVEQLRRQLLEWQEQHGSTTDSS